MTSAGASRVLAALLAVLLAWPAVTHARVREGVKVGFETLSIPNGDEPALAAGVWYPTSGIPSAQPLDTFVQEVAPGGPVRGRSLPLVVMSHGGGGSFAGHYDTALALARAGFVVAAISHAGDTYDDQSRVLELWRRPAQLSRLVTFMLQGWRGHGSIDARRIGAFGFSNGGFTVLVAAGAVPDLSRIDTYCRVNPSHDLCVALRQAGVPSVAGIRPPADAWRPDRRIRAVVAAAPAFGFAFDREGVRGVTVPVQLWGAASDLHQPSPWYEQRVRDLLRRPPEYNVVSGAGHYSFLPPCSARLARGAPQICNDGAGFDRTAFHRRFNAAIARFLKAKLR